MVLSTSLERMCSRHTEDSGGVMRFVCSMDRLQVVATRQGCGIRITLPAAEPETLLDLFCSPLSGRTFQVDRFDLSSHLKIEVYLLLLVGLVTKVWRSIVDRKFIRGFGFDQLSCFRLGARWRSWVFGSKIALFVSLWAIILETMEKGNTRFIDSRKIFKLVNNEKEGNLLKFWSNQSRSSTLLPRRPQVARLTSRSANLIVYF